MAIKIINVSGQTCNKFWILSRYVSDAIANDDKILVLNPDITLRDYPRMQSSNVLIFPFYSDLWIRVFGYKQYIKFLDKILNNRVTPRILKVLFKLFSIEYISASTGGVRSPNKAKYFKELVELFRPAEEIIKHCSNIFESKRLKTEVIIGLHIRRGDYETHKNGKYFYSLEQYREKLFKLIPQFEGKEVSVFIASNERIDLSSFEDINCFKIEQGSATKDLISLSMCDYILGPPSTYSAWAAYIGNKPIYFIEDLAVSPKLKDFRSILDIFKG